MDISNAFDRISSEVSSKGLSPEALPGLAILILCECAGLAVGFIADSVLRARKRRAAEIDALDGKMFVDGQWVDVFPDDQNWLI